MNFEQCNIDLVFQNTTRSNFHWTMLHTYKRVNLTVSSKNYQKFMNGAIKDENNDPLVDQNGYLNGPIYHHD